ncbi:MAG TPA: hypothetical protein VFU16_06940 [Solirubrobacterales bacterium]|nr:hypothetical protein [Solirubrobacterales bacterium]
MKDVRKLVLAVLVVVAAGALAACGSSDDSTTASAGDDSEVSGEFAPVADAPAGYSKVTGEADLERADGGTTVSIQVSGLEPSTPYVAHLHSGVCAQPDPGGPHFQFEKGGSEEPPNEIHLEFTSDGKGEGEAEATSKREVPVGEAGSVVLHAAESHNATSAYVPGEAETVFVHEGVDHSQEGAGHPEPAHSDKIACAPLETAAEESATEGGGEVPTIVVRDGEPVGGVQELEYSAGEQVRFRVSSDAAEEVHVHGYDISKEVPAGGTVEFDFPAELEGIYEAEIEELGVQIVELRVNP